MNDDTDDTIPLEPLTSEGYNNDFHLFVSLLTPLATPITLLSTILCTYYYDSTMIVPLLPW